MDSTGTDGLPTTKPTPLPFKTMKPSTHAERKTHAQQTAIARGFDTVAQWMRENQKAAAMHRAKKTPQARALARALDDEHNQFNPYR